MTSWKNSRLDFTMAQMFTSNERGSFFSTFSGFFLGDIACEIMA
jgi:hypothetical protein